MDKIRVSDVDQDCIDTVPHLSDAQTTIRVTDDVMLLLNILLRRIPVMKRVNDRVWLMLQLPVGFGQKKLISFI